MNPVTLQAIGLMAGIAGSERLHESLKQKGANILAELLDMVEKDVDQMKGAYSPIQRIK